MNWNALRLRGNLSDRGTEILSKRLRGRDEKEEAGESFIKVKECLREKEARGIRKDCHCGAEKNRRRGRKTA